MITFLTRGNNLISFLNKIILKVKKIKINKLKNIKSMLS